jgi:hypothetical protein
MDVSSMRFGRFDISTREKRRLTSLFQSHYLDTLRLQRERKAADVEYLIVRERSSPNIKVQRGRF